MTLAEQLIERGVEQGIEQGIEQDKIEIAGNMLLKGYSDAEIEEITGLTLKVIKGLRK